MFDFNGRHKYLFFYFQLNFYLRKPERERENRKQQVTEFNVLQECRRR